MVKLTPPPMAFVKGAAALSIFCPVFCYLFPYFFYLFEYKSCRLCTNRALFVLFAKFVACEIPMSLRVVFQRKTVSPFCTRYLCFLFCVRNVKSRYFINFACFIPTIYKKVTLFCSCVFRGWPVVQKSVFSGDFFMNFWFFVQTGFMDTKPYKLSAGNRNSGQKAHFRHCVFAQFAVYSGCEFECTWVYGKMEKG